MLTQQRLKLTRRGAVPAPGKDHQDKLEGFWLVPNLKVTKVPQSPLEHTELFRQGCAGGKSTGGDTGRAVSQAQPQLSREGGFAARVVSQKLQEHCRTVLAPGTREARPFPRCHREASAEIFPRNHPTCQGGFGLEFMLYNAKSACKSSSSKKGVHFNTFPCI